MATDSTISSKPSTRKRGWETFLNGIKGILPNSGIITDVSRRVALSTDASFYHKVPKLVLQIETLAQMQAVLRLAQSTKTAVTFRAAGTSLSGQAISDSVLILLSPHWQQAEILESGDRISLQPGIIGDKANRLLAPFGRKIGPDPASINTCKIGGIAANNASGMCCGVKHNSYHTMTDICFTLADGSTIDTADPGSVNTFRKSHATLLSALSAIAANLRKDEVLSEQVRHQYRLKNTMGYGLNALLDYEDPLDILSHLLIGSEGTLGFIANITYRTIPVLPSRATGLYLFRNLQDACVVIPALQQLNVEAVELMDARALNSVASLLHAFYPHAIENGAAALLIDVGEHSEDLLNTKLIHLAKVLSEGAHAAKAMCEFTRDPLAIESLWRIRKGLFPAVGAVRETGTTVIIEDVAFPLEQLAEGVSALAGLFEYHGYDEAIIFGHALDGNVHFVFTQGFETANEIARYDSFMQDVVKLVTRQFDGTLKAEHGTGRNMAPFLYAQWGEAGVAIMQKIKKLIDPAGILNPGVIINADNQAHLQHLKAMPAVDPIVDKCIECGFCEPQCPSLNFTLSPRQRIALRRRQQHMPVASRQEIDNAFNFLGIESCAATGLCATTCPVGIDTGEWIKKLRFELAGSDGVAKQTSSFLSPSLAIGRFTLSAVKQAAKWVQPETVERASWKLHRWTQRKTPVWYQDIPAGAKIRTPSGQPFSDKAVFFSTCPNRLFGADEDSSSMLTVVSRLLNKAGIEVIFPDDMDSACCGQPWETKGFPDQAKARRQDWYKQLTRASENGKWPIILDASPCALQVHDFADLAIYELSEYLLEHVVPRVRIHPSNETIMLHTTCSSTHLDKGYAIQQLASLCCTHIVQPEDITCCGFAGDKGLLLPELNASALASLKQSVPHHCNRGISNSRTCEIGLSHHSGVPYHHIVYLLDEVSKPRSFADKE